MSAWNEWLSLLWQVWGEPSVTPEPRKPSHLAEACGFYVFPPEP